MKIIQRGGRMEYYQMKHFCDDSREALSEPFRLEDGFVYASNGRAIIRTKDVKFDIDPSPHRHQKTIFCFPWQNRENLKLQDFPTLPKETVKYDACPECNLLGYVKHSNEYSDYTMDCKTCEGMGQIEKRLTLQIERNYFTILSLYMASRLPESKFSPIIKKDMLPFFFKNGEGFLMAISQWQE
jgi:hypothetical protein